MSGPAPWRVIAQRILTGEFLHWDVPLNDTATSRELSGPGGVFGSVAPVMLDQLGDDGRPLLEEWSTALYVEQDGQIRAGGLISRIKDQGAVRTIEAPGLSGYPNGVPCLDDYTPTDFEDPITIWKNLWAYLQSFPDADFGISVSGPTTYFRVSSGSGPYRLYATDVKDVGGELSSLAESVPFDFIETHKWADVAHTSISHAITAGFPRMGKRQLDMRFADGENVVDYSEVGADGERYANDVVIRGPGEGRAQLRSRKAVRDGRVRRVAVVPVKDGSQGQLDRRATHELAARGLKPDIADITIKDSQQARISAIQPGDDIFVQLDLEWRGILRDWYRVLAINEAADAQGMAVLKLQRSDAFTYAAEKSYDGQSQVLVL